MAVMLGGTFAAIAAFWLWIQLTNPVYASNRGLDFSIYHDAAARWLAGGSFYYPEQIAGPYETVVGHVMYPPVALVLFVPFVYLPAVLWWAVPIAVVAGMVAWLRPGRWGIVGMLGLLALPNTIAPIITGNPVLWITAAFALSLRWPAAGVLVLFKPSVFPFALGGIRQRTWWLALGALGLVSLAFVGMWTDWLAVVLNARGHDSGLLYSARDVPIMLIPLVAWLGRAKPS